MKRSRSINYRLNLIKNLIQELEGRKVESYLVYLNEKLEIVCVLIANNFLFFKLILVPKNFLFSLLAY